MTWRLLDIFKKRSNNTSIKPSLRLNILTYCPKEDYFTMTIAPNLKKFGSLIYASRLDEYYQLLKTNPVDIVVILQPRNILTIDNLKNMIIYAKSSKKNCKVIIFEQHQLASISMSSGADYFCITDNNEYHKRFNIRDKMFIINVHFLLRIVENMIYNSQFGQDERALIIEKKEFYESVKNILYKRSTLTADIHYELEFLSNTLSKYRCISVLDAGCATGRITEPLAQSGFIMTGIDITESYINNANKKRNNENNPKYFLRSILQTNLDPNLFDAIILMWHVICDLKKHHEKMFTEAHRILKHGGIIIFDFPDIEQNSQIQKDGYYEDKGAGLLKYRGLVPQIDSIIELVNAKDFEVVEYHRVHWGIDKYVVVAMKK